MNHQDWNQINIGKKSNQQTIKQTTTKQPLTYEAAHNHRLEQEDPPKLKVVGRQLGNQIQSARMARGLKQCDLARQLCVPVQVIVDYETGKAVYNPNILQKLRSFFKIDLKIKK